MFYIKGKKDLSSWREKRKERQKRGYKKALVLWERVSLNWNTRCKFILKTHTHYAEEKDELSSTANI